MASIINAIVTGANSGLGLGICLRLIDDFLKLQRADTRLNVIYTTRSTAKGAATLSTLKAHLQRNHPSHLHGRVTFQPENVELTNLLSVLALARKLTSSDIGQIDVVVFNAGIGGWSGLNWFKAVPDVLMDIRNNTTWPAFKLGIVGAVTEQQLPGDSSEPPLGEVFCANLFGHYMLAHWLMPLLQACDASSPGKIIWVSSVEPQSYHFSFEDLQGLLTDAAYESSKRLTDILGLTSTHSRTKASVSSFESLPSSLVHDPLHRQSRSTPTQHVYQPGILVTSVISLYWIVSQGYLLAIYFARWMGGVWSNVEPYTAAHGATWLAFAPQHEIIEAEAKVAPSDSRISSTSVQNGRVKWGTSITWLGKTTVRPTEVDKWGLTGNGQPYAADWWGGKLGRKPGAVEAKATDVQEFVGDGVDAWKAMENLRVEWEHRIEKYESSK